MQARAAPSAGRLFRLGRCCLARAGFPRPIYVNSIGNSAFAGSYGVCAEASGHWVCKTPRETRGTAVSSLTSPRVRERTFWESPLTFFTAHLGGGTCHARHFWARTAGGSGGWHVQRKLPPFSFAVSHFEFFFLSTTSERQGVEWGPLFGAT